jgi:predicted murein hydrolase (TIGR00659 family)
VTDTLLPARALDIWVYLSASPLLWLAATLVAYSIADYLSALAGRHPLVNPVAISALLLIGLLLATHTDYKTFFAGAQFVHFLLGPATVSLAIPLYRNRRQVVASLAPMALALLAGCLTAIISAVGIGALLDAPREVLLSLAPKSVTAPIAMSLAQSLGGEPTLTAALVVLTGIFGATFLTPFLNLIRVRDRAARGFAAGVAAHGLGAARAFQVGPVEGAFAGIAMGLNGALTSVLLPALAALLALVWP